MAKTATRPVKKKPATGGKGPKKRRKRYTPPPWYRRGDVMAWLVAAIVVAVIAFNFLGDDQDRGTPGKSVSEPVVGADLHSLAVDPDNPSKLYIGSHSGVSVSTDGGKTWAAEPTLDGADGMGWAFTDDAIYVGGHPGLLVSTDGGDTFEQRNEGLPSTDVHALGAGDGEIYGASPATGLFASTDDGASWEVVNEEVGQSFMGRILVDPSDRDHVIAPDMSNGAVESTDGGKTWRALSGVPAAMWVSWAPGDPEHLVVTGQGAAAESTDGGQSWDELDIPSGASIVEFSPDDQSILYAAVLNDPTATVYVSNDGGKSWDET